MRRGSRLLCGWNLICCRLLIIETRFHREAWTIALSTLPPLLAACRTTCMIVQLVWHLDDMGECCRVSQTNSWFGRPEHRDTCESLPPNLLFPGCWSSLWFDRKTNQMNYERLKAFQTVRNSSRYVKHGATATESLANPLHVFHFRALRYSHLN